MRILIIEDNPDHRGLIKHTCYMAFQNVELDVEETLVEGVSRLLTGEYDICLSDLNFPASPAGDTIPRLTSLKTATPIVVLTSSRDEEDARDLLKGGVQDYLPKEEITDFQLRKVITYAIERKRHLQMLEESNREQARLIQELKTASNKITHLEGIIPICACCKNVRNDDGYWQKVEGYLHQHLNADFSHGMCPECLSKSLEELDNIKPRYN